MAKRKRNQVEPPDKIAGYLEIGRTANFEVVVNLDRDRHWIGHIVFSPRQARHLATLLIKHAEWAEAEREEGA